MSSALNSLTDIEGPISVPRSAPINDPLADAIKSSDVIADRLKAARRDDKEELDFLEDCDDPAPDTVCGWMHDEFYKAKNHKLQSCTHDRLVKNFRMYKMQYSEAEKQLNGGADTAHIFIPLIASLCRRMHAFLRDTLADDRDHPMYDYRPTTVPDIPEFLRIEGLRAIEQEVLLLLEMGIVVTPSQIAEEVEKFTRTLYERAIDDSWERARECKRQADDRLEESNYRVVFDKILLDACWSGIGIMQGPYTAMKKKPYWSSDAEAPAKLTYRWEKYLEWRSLDPFYIFPTPDSEDTQDGQGIFYLEKLRICDLNQLRSMNGYLSDNIELVLRENENGSELWGSMFTSEIERIRAQHVSAQCDDRHDLLRYWGKVPGKMLKQIGVDHFNGMDIDELDEYEAELACIGSIPIYAKCNQDPACERNIHMFGLFDCPEAFWKYGVADVIETMQRKVNSAARSLVRDLGFSSLPMAEIDRGLLADGFQLDNLMPGLIVEKDSRQTGLSGAALAVHQIQSNAPLHMQIIRECTEQAELMLGLPRYLTGATAATGAARTATGLQQLQSNAFVNVKSVIVNIDQGIVQPSMSQLHRWLMVTTDDPYLQGDVEVVTMGATQLLARQVNKDGLLGNIGGLFPFIQAGMIPPEGALELLREFVQTIGLDPRRVVPDAQFEQAKLAELQQLIQSVAGISGGVGAAAQLGGTGAVGQGQQGQVPVAGGQPPPGGPAQQLGGLL